VAGILIFEKKVSSRKFPKKNQTSNGQDIYKTRGVVGDNDT